MNKIDLFELKEISNSLYAYVTNLSSMEHLTMQDESLDGVVRLADRLEKMVNNLSFDDQYSDENKSLFCFNVLFLGDKDKLQVKIDPIYKVNYLPVGQLNDLNKILENNRFQIVLIEQNSLISQIDLSNFDTKNICFLSIYSDQSSIIKHQIFTEYLALDDLKSNFNALLDKNWNTLTQNHFLKKLELGKTLSIMSVEDDLDSRKSLNELLSSYGFNVTNCSTANEAFSLMSSESYDIIILDIGLEDLDGYQLALRIRQIQKMKRDLLCPILVNSGRANDIDEDIKFYGITEYYQKPFLTKKLSNVLGKYLPKSCF